MRVFHTPKSLGRVFTELTNNWMDRWTDGRMDGQMQSDTQTITGLTVNKTRY